MKLFFVVVSFGLLATVLSESCTVGSDCTATTCGAGNTVVCQHPDSGGVVADGGLCTCQDGTSSGGCVLASDCYGTDIVLNCKDAQRHCYDNRCICDRFQITG